MIISAKQDPLIQTIKQKASQIKISEGDVVEAIFVKITPKGAFFDLGKFGTGIIYGVELLNARDIVKKLNPGDKILAKILVLENEDGFRELSLTEADKQKSWQKLRELEESGEIVSMKITGANSGGLIGELFEIKAFLPISKLSPEHVPTQINDRQKLIEELKKFIGKELNVKVITVNPKNNKLIVSEKEVVSANIKELLEQYKPGQILDAIVSGIADFGVFARLADNPQIEGIIYPEELDYKIIDNPKDVLKINDFVKVKILEIKDNKLILSIKATKPNPWENIENEYKIGSEVLGTVYKFTPFGAIIHLNSVSGVIHVTDFGGYDEMKKTLEIGKQYKFIVHQIKPEEQRIILKLGNN